MPLILLLALRLTSKALINVCSAHTLIGDWERGHGDDPRPSWERAVEICGRASALDPLSTYPYNTLGTMFSGRAEWELGRGLDPEAAVTGGIAALKKAIELQPTFAFAHNNLATLYSTRAAWQQMRGVDCRAAVD